MFHNFMMNTCRTDANWLYLIVHAEFIRKNHVEMWVSPMIIWLLRNVYLFMSQSSCICIALYVLKLQSFDYKEAFTYHLTKTYYWEIYIYIYIVITDIYNLLYCYKDLIDLYYKLSEFHDIFWPYNYQYLIHIAYFAQFDIPIKLDVIPSPVIKSWCIKMIGPYSHIFAQFEIPIKLDVYCFSSHTILMYQIRYTTKNTFFVRVNWHSSIEPFKSGISFCT